MNPMRNRVKEHFPTVLLTLLSIVQALALELLWSALQETRPLFELTWTALTGWTQITATVLGIVLIWVVYASNAMRFRWVPTTSDSVYPFFIGLMEFMQIEYLGTENLGQWFFLMAVIFGTMVWVSHTTMKRARLDGSSKEFFKSVRPATMRDFAPHIATVSVILLAGVYMLLSENIGPLAFLFVFSTLVLLVWQLYDSSRFWEISVAEDPQV